MIVQGIVTKYTNGKYIATTASGLSVRVPTDYALDSYHNHQAAAVALAKKLKWYGEWYSGGGPKNTVLWVQDTDEGFKLI